MVGDLIGTVALGVLDQQREFGLRQQSAIGRESAIWPNLRQEQFLISPEIKYKEDSTIDQLQHEVDEWLKDTI